MEERPYEWIGAGRINVSVMQGLVASVDSCAHVRLVQGKMGSGEVNPLFVSDRHAEIW